jgi:hypothetical protein
MPRNSEEDGLIEDEEEEEVAAGSEFAARAAVDDLFEGFGAVEGPRPMSIAGAIVISTQYHIFFSTCELCRERDMKGIYTLSWPVFTLRECLLAAGFQEERFWNVVIVLVC